MHKQRPFPKKRVRRKLAGSKGVEDELNQFQKLETIGLLASGIAHDFNNLLTGIRGSVAMALSEIGPDHAGAGNLLDAERATQCGMDLVRQLLDYVRQTDTTPRRILSLNNRLQEVVALLRHLVDSKIDIRCELDPKLGNIHAVPANISQILMNLCLNAADAMPGGGTILLQTRNVEGSFDLLDRLGTSRLKTSAALRQSTIRMVEVSVSDTGHGMERKTLQHIFDPFFSKKGATKGNGLGLTVVRNLVAHNHGTIHVSSRPGKGTTFSVRFPCSRKPAHPHSTIQATARTPASDEKLSGDGEIILLIENDELVRHVSRKILVRAGFQVLEAKDGVQATELFRNSQASIGLIVLDLNLPKKSGREVLQEIRTQDRQIPVILSSGFSLEISREDLERFGATDILHKPYLPAEFLTMVRSHLRSRVAGVRESASSEMASWPSSHTFYEGRRTE
jgi:nitrogen-specific signal transduction histidine kinase/CheY-like chemotaxis protein